MHSVRLLPSVLFLSLAVAPLLPAAELVLVENGQPKAEIVISEKPARSVRLAAHELQSQLQKISGARLSIVTQPTGKALKIFIGESPHAAAAGIDSTGLSAGAYRMVSGSDWLALIGDDRDFTPREPWARNNTDIRSGKLQSEFNKLTGAQWGAPNGGMYKNKLRLPGEIGKPEGAATEKGELSGNLGF
jgi:hypothetical protein